MKTFVFAIIVAIGSASSALAGERGVNLSVPGMFCASCPYVVQAAIGEVDGVLSVTTDANDRTAFVLYDDAVVTIEEITEASANAGYEATVIVAGADQG